MPYNGYEFEEIVAERLRKYGYKVKLTRKSGDFGADIIAKKDNRKIAIQVKSWDKPVGVRAIQEVLGGKSYYHCNEAWVVSKSGFTERAIELARKAHVKLLTFQDLEIYEFSRNSQEYSSVEYDNRWHFQSRLVKNTKQRNVSTIKSAIASFLVGLILATVLLTIAINHSPFYAPVKISNTQTPLKVPNTQTETSFKAETQGLLKFVLPVMNIPQIPNMTVLFFDDFERYQTGTLMGTQNGWFPIWDWNGKSFEQKIVEGISVSGIKSFQLWGDPCVNAGYHRYLYYNNTYRNVKKTKIGIETYVGIEGYGNPRCGDKFEENAVTALVGFWNLYDKKYYAIVSFKRNGEIYANGQLIGKWEPRKWYHVRIIMNWEEGIFDVYINGEKIGKGIPVNKFNPRYHNYDGIIIASGHAGVKVFYDNFTIFQLKTD